MMDQVLTDDTSDLGNKDDDKKGNVGVEQALLLLPSTTTAKESYAKDDATYE